MRLKSEIWVKAYLRRCQHEGAAAVLVRRGDTDAGAIYVKISRLDGTAALFGPAPAGLEEARDRDRKSTRLNSSHSQISYAVFCLKKKKQNYQPTPKVIQLSAHQGGSSSPDGFPSVDVRLSIRDYAANHRAVDI